MPALLLVAVALGLDNLAAAVGLGVAGAGARLRIGLVFGAFETGMPLIGLLLGHGLAPTLGSGARWLGAALLIACGGYPLLQAVRGNDAQDRDGAAASRIATSKLLVTGFALSIDNLAVGFALGAYRVTLALAVAVIGAVSVLMSLLGLELGARLGARTGERGELVSGLILIGVGIALAGGAT